MGKQLSKKNGKDRTNERYREVRHVYVVLRKRDYPNYLEGYDYVRVFGTRAEAEDFLVDIAEKEHRKYYVIRTEKL